MKTLKKVSALILALAMVVAMGATVFAANSDDTTNTWNGIVTSDTTIGIAKQIVFINAEDTAVREPNITYTYTIATTTPGTAKVAGYDNPQSTEKITSTVKPGPIDAVTSTTATVTFADTATAAATSDGTGTADIKYADFTFTPAAFGAPGIYRYEITETSNVTKASVGITEAATYSDTRYLDVYVKKTSSTDPTLVIYGYVLFEGTATDSIDADTAADLAKKSAGYVNTSDTAGSQEDVDVYTTQNIYIEKTTTGVMADTAHDFPISITLAAATGVTATPKIDVVLGGNGTLTGTASDAVGAYINFATSMSGTVDNASSIYLKGIPAGATVSLTETNDTADSYKTKAGTTSGAADLLAEKTIAAGAATDATTTQTLNAKAEIYITNTLEAISPTGVVLRFGPYALMLAVGVALLALAMYRGKNRREEN